MSQLESVIGRLNIDPRDVQAWEALYRHTARTGDRSLLPLVEVWAERVIEGEVGELDWYIPFAHLDTEIAGGYTALPRMDTARAAALWLCGFDAGDASRVATLPLMPTHEIDGHMIDPRLFRYSRSDQGLRDIQYTEFKRLRDKAINAGGLALAIGGSLLVATTQTATRGHAGCATCAAPGLEHTQGSNNWTRFEYVIPAQTRFEAFLAMFAAARIARGDLWSQAYREQFRPRPRGIGAKLMEWAEPEKAEQEKAAHHETVAEQIRRYVWGVGLDVELVQDGAVWIGRVGVVPFHVVSWLQRAMDGFVVRVVDGVLTIDTDHCATSDGVDLATGEHACL